MAYDISPSLSDLIHSSNSRSLKMAFWVNMFTICSVLPDFFMWVLNVSLWLEYISSNQVPESTFIPILHSMF